jgi:TonB family protein
LKKKLSALRKLLLLMICSLWGYVSFAQTAEIDTTIYTFAEEMPRFPGCEELDTTIQAKYKCSQQVMLNFIYQSVIYPFEAREAGNEGTVVTSFVVEPNGMVSQAEVLRDIGGGCGAETVRVIESINSGGIRFIPGKKGGKAVRVKVTVPIKFEIKEAPPFVIVNGDSIWVTVDTPLDYIGGKEALSAHLKSKIKYPESGIDSCLVGDIDVQIKVDRGGGVSVLDMTDYCNLGFDFWFASTNAVTSTYGQWMVATYKNNPVPAVYEVTLPFRPEAASCKQTVADYKKANDLAAEAVNLYNEKKDQEAIQKLTEAITAFDKNASYYYLRGQIHINNNQFNEACEDLRKAKEIAQLSDFDSVLSVICK